MIKTSVKTILLIFLVLYGNLEGASKRLLVDEIRIDSTMLVTNFHAEGLIDKEIIERLKNGFTSTLEYQVQLWKRKPLVFNELVYEGRVRRKLAYDNWDKKYIVATEKEIRQTSSLEKVRKMCLDIQDFALLPVNKIKKKSEYFITVQLLLKPMSVETLEEMSHWFKRKDESSDPMQKENPGESKDRKFSSRILKFFAAFTGLSDKMISSKSPSFKVDEELKVIWLE